MKMWPFLLQSGVARRERGLDASPDQAHKDNVSEPHQVSRPPSIGLETCCHGGAKKETLELATRELSVLYGYGEAPREGAFRKGSGRHAG
jgi:hypothetical protein